MILGSSCVVAALMLSSGCRREQPFRIGVVLGDEGVHGAALAVADANAHGGLHGRPLELRSLRGAYGTKASVALQAAETLATDRTVLAVVGHANSSASLAASQIYNARHVVQIAPTSSTPLYSDAGPYSFRLVASDLHQGVFLANTVLAGSPRARVAVMYVNDDYGRSLRDVVVERLRAGKVVPVYDAPFDEEAAVGDEGEIVTALAAAKPQTLIWLGRSAKFLALASPLKAALPGLSVVASDGFGGAAVEHDPQHRLDGVHYVRIVDLSHPDSALRRLQARYSAAGWGELSDQAVLAYDAVALLAEAVRESGRDRDAIRVWLSGVGARRRPFDGLSGPIAFSANGDRTPSYHLVRIGPAAGGAASDTTSRGGGGV